MTRGDSAIFVQIKTARKELADKQERIREELAAAGNDPSKLSPQKRRIFCDCGLALRLVSDVEAQLIGGASDDLPGTISQLMGLLKQLQTAALPGNATPAHGSPITGPPTPPPRPSLRPSLTKRP
jgi:hypothetical protein